MVQAWEERESSTATAIAAAAAADVEYLNVALAAAPMQATAYHHVQPPIPSLSAASTARVQRTSRSPLLYCELFIFGPSVVGTAVVIRW
jgi:hypothetical protein